MNKLSFLEFLKYRSSDIFKLTGQHIRITGIAVLLAVLVGVPLGIYITKNKKVSNAVLNLANIFQTLPSLALFGLIIPIMGIGFKPAIFVLFLYALLPIIKNTYIGINSIEPSIIEAGRGMGMTKAQILTMVEIPLALPIIMGGIRISTVINIGTATIAALIGAGGLGDFIFKGISMSNNNMILAGAVPTALLAISVDFLLGIVENKLTPIGVKNV
ncbi:ABC transporter permease [uncultured Ilyobacter sp.]|uniref:ABC transporter permease n=1 Tax=uncultured Ilyobacter sp. TaxID=544433 RepID=UPI0029C8165E|nr:ABC transporter permease [uncultured Ilyobacter sp.]